MPTIETPTAVVEQFRRDIERNVLRARNGLKHLAGVGRVEVGCSAKELVWERDKVRLYRYDSDHRSLAPPILIVMSLVSKPYIVDLRPGNSFVESLLERGLDVYLLDWGIPDAADADNTLETYCDEYLPYAAVAAMRESARDEIHVLGYCLGGLLSAVFAAGHPEIPLRSLTLLATPVNFAEMGAMTTMVRDERLDLNQFVDATGNIPSEVMLRAVNLMRVTGQASTYAALLDQLDNSEYIAAHQAMHGWATDHIPFPGACFRQIAVSMVRENRLAENRLVTGRGRIDLASITCPVLNVVGLKDYLVPVAANEPILSLIPQLEDLRFDTGHIGLVVGGKAHRSFIPVLVDWLVDHSEELA